MKTNLWAKAIMAIALFGILLGYSFYTGNHWINW